MLTDDEKRRTYDVYGEEGLKGQGQGGGGFGHGDPFDFFFGGFGRQNMPREKKGHSLELDLHVTLEELFLGTTVEVRVFS